MRLEGLGRKAAALGVLGVLAATSWVSMEGGRPRELVVILLGGFALRIVLTRAGSGYHGDGTGE